MDWTQLGNLVGALGTSAGNVASVLQPNTPVVAPVEAATAPAPAANSIWKPIALVASVVVFGVVFFWAMKQTHK